MSVDRDVLELECQLRLIEHARANVDQAPPEPIDLWIEGFWAGVRAAAKPRSTSVLQNAITAARQNNSPTVPPKRSRRVPNFG